MDPDLLMPLGMTPERITATARAQEIASESQSAQAIRNTQLAAAVTRLNDRSDKRNERRLEDNAKLARKLSATELDVVTQTQVKVITGAERKALKAIAKHRKDTVKRSVNVQNKLIKRATAKPKNSMFF